MIDEFDRTTACKPIDVESWHRSGYQPTPTIVEAAQALYQNHAVEEIARSDASVQNLSLTTNRISGIIDRSKSEGRTSICLVTGVRGAGHAGWAQHRNQARPRAFGRTCGFSLWQTRLPTYYEETFAFLKACGLKELMYDDADTTLDPRKYAFVASAD